MGPGRVAPTSGQTLRVDNHCAVPQIPLRRAVKKKNKPKQNKQAPGGNMNREEALCDDSTDFTEEKIQDEEEETLRCNRIFLNFTRECRHPAKDRFNIAKAKDLFKYLSERQDLQEMKVSGWLEEGEPKGEVEDEEAEEEAEGEEKNGMESCFGDRSTPRGGGQRFAMSRDFWYRKLNTLKAQKLDEVALEAKDLPPDNHQKEPKGLNWVKDKKIFASDIPETRKSVLEEIECFERRVVKPLEKGLKNQSVGIYDNRKSFLGASK